MLLNYFRIIKYDVGLTDLSLKNYDPNATVPITLESNDYLYLGQRLPFNNIFFHVDTANTASGALYAQYWDGTAWRDGVDVLDGTVSGSTTIGRSGNYRFTLDADYNWQMVIDTADASGPDELESLDIYDTYWMRLYPQNNMSSGVLAKELGYCFTTSEQLKSFDIEIDNFFSAFESGKTDWINEIKTASRLVVNDLRSKGLILHPGQIIDMDDVWLPTTLKTLSLIYSNLGPSYKEKRAAIELEYKEALSNKRFTFDTDANGRVEQREINNNITTRTR